MRETKCIHDLKHWLRRNRDPGADISEDAILLRHLTHTKLTGDVCVKAHPRLVVNSQELTVVDQDMQRDLLGFEVVHKLPDGVHGRQVAVQKLHWGKKEKRRVAEATDMISKQANVESTTDVPLQKTRQAQLCGCPLK